MKATPTHERPKVINLTDFNQKHRFQICLLQSFSYFRLYTFMSIYVKNPADLVYVLSVTICKTIFDPQRG